MWVEFLSSFAGGRKKQNKFPSNLHCPVKKLNPFYFYYLSLSYLSGRLSFLHLLPTVWRLAQWRISEHKTVNTPQMLMRGRIFN
jgi:hypothetical protein